MQASTIAFPCGEAERRRLVRLCAALSGDAGAAEDLAQETLLEGWRNLDKLHDRDGAERWLAAVARNVCLRWGRRAGREAAVETAVRAVASAAEAVDFDEELDRADLESLLGHALALLSREARDVLVRRYIDGVTSQELAAALGVSEDAIAMRLARAKAALRRLLATELRDAGAELGLIADDDASWRATRVWCGQCGARRLLTRTTASPTIVSFRCPGCMPAPAGAGAEYHLDNPYFARLLGAVARPTAVLARAAEWSQRYFAGGAGTEVACTRCAAPVPLRRYEREATPGDAPHRHGLHASCEACGEAVSSSLGGLVTTLPQLRSLRRDHARTVVRGVRAVDVGGTPAFVTEVASVGGSAGFAAFYSRHTLRLLSVR
ncbi:MAG TPA: RNA polymerase sigma factor [Gaiellaceae bacterium]|nr:RNA polymerase sigma factor [Gaiellaceae bacterium]